MNYDAKRIVHVSENLLMYKLISATKCQVKLKDSFVFNQWWWRRPQLCRANNRNWHLTEGTCLLKHLRTAFRSQ